MCMRQGLLGFVAMLASVAAVQATPPENPQVEGREPNPVVREFYGMESDQFEYAGEESVEALAAGWWGSHAALGAVFNKLTMPLGPMELWD